MFRPEIKFILDSGTEVNSTKHIEAECIQTPGESYIKWRVVNHVNHVNHVVYEEHLEYILNTRPNRILTENRSPELIRRISKSGVIQLLPFIIHSPYMQEAKNAMTNIFINLFYPDLCEDNTGPVDDEYNAWIQKYIPEFHDSMARKIIQKRLNLIKRIMDV